MCLTVGSLNDLPYGNWRGERALDHNACQGHNACQTWDAEYCALQSLPTLPLCSKPPQEAPKLQASMLHS